MQQSHETLLILVHFRPFPHHLLKKVTQKTGNVLFATVLAWYLNKVRFNGVANASIKKVAIGYPKSRDKSSSNDVIVPSALFCNLYVILMYTGIKSWKGQKGKNTIMLRTANKLLFDSVFIFIMQPTKVNFLT